MANTPTQIQTKALSAYLVTRYTSLAGSLATLGLDQKLLNHDTISDDVMGRIARLLNLTPDKLCALAAPYGAASSPPTA